MRWAVVAARTFVGLVFLVFGLNGFLNFIPMQSPTDPLPLGFMKLMFMDSHYMHAVKVLEIIGGVLLIAGRFVPLGIVILAPITVNIVFFEAFLLKAPGPGVVLLPLMVFLIWGYRSYFCPLFATNAKIG